MSELINADLVDLDVAGDTRDEVTRALVTRLVEAGRATDADGLVTDLHRREEQMPTGLEGGIGIPHARSEHVTEPTLAFGHSRTGVDFGASDGPARLIFLIAAPASGGEDHMSILAALARRLVHQNFRDRLLTAADADEVVELVHKEVLGQ